MITPRSVSRMLLPLVALLGLFAAVAPSAQAGQVTAPIKRAGITVGTATAYYGSANGHAILEPRISNFTPPMTGVRYTTYVQLRASCEGSDRMTWNGRPRGANFTGATNFWTHGLIKQCSFQSGSVEVLLFIKRASTGAIVGRAQLFSAG